ncbi:MAG: TIGR00153 family protein [Candidatus Magnetomorum sp.]|nr:TIGR00153 family protein [Candidatus Magnetomorum sp.]
MRIPFVNMFMTSPFVGLKEHAEKVSECSLLFQQAIECRISDKCDSFGAFRKEVKRLENDADAIKRRIRGHLPKGTFLAVDKFQIFRYIKEQDKVLDKVEDVLDWISFKPDFKINDEIAQDIKDLVDMTLNPIEKLSVMIENAVQYFQTFSEDDRNAVKDVIHQLRKFEHEADIIEKKLKRKIFEIEKDPVNVFFLVRLVEDIGAIADHAENTGDMMRAMISR